MIFLTEVWKCFLKPLFLKKEKEKEITTYIFQTEMMLENVLKSFKFLFFVTYYFSFFQFGFDIYFLIQQNFFLNLCFYDLICSDIRFQPFKTP